MKRRIKPGRSRHALAFLFAFAPSGVPESVMQALVRQPAWVLSLACSLLLVGCAPKAEETPAIVLQGHVEGTFAGKHNNAGSFTVKACGSNALIDVVFENGYREISGTDGRDTFTYNPFTGDKTVITNAGGIGDISYGRFPTNAHFFEQILWLVCVHDPELLTNLQSFRFPFYGDYDPGEITLRIRTSGLKPDLISSIQWFAPGYMHGAGTNHYELAMYPNGWLVAEVSVTERQVIGKVTVPTKIAYTQYAQRFITNALQLTELHNRVPNDVLPVEVATFAINDARVDRRLSSYVPRIFDRVTRVDDRRIGRVVAVASGEAWTALREMPPQHDLTFWIFGSHFGLVGFDAWTLPTGIQRKAHTNLCLASRTLDLPLHIYWVTGIGLGFSFIAVLSAAIAWRRIKWR